MKVIRVGKKATKPRTAKIEAPCCYSLLSVVRSDVIKEEHGTYEFACGHCDMHFFWSTNWFDYRWKQETPQ